MLNKTRLGIITVAWIVWAILFSIAAEYFCSANLHQVAINCSILGAISVTLYACTEEKSNVHYF